MGVLQRSQYQLDAYHGYGVDEAFKRFPNYALSQNS